MTFVALAVGLWVSALLAWLVLSRAMRKSSSQRIRERLSGQPKEKKAAAAKPALIDPGSRQPSLASRVLRALNLYQRLHDLLEQSGLKWTASKTVNVMLVMCCAGTVAGLVLLPAGFKMLAAVTGIAAASLPLLHVTRRRKKRLARFQELFPDSLEFVSRSMRAGHAFSVALEMVHHEFQEPLAGEFRRAFEEHNLGLPLDVALQKLARRVPSLDVHFFVSAVLLQKRTGGNLAEILDKLAYLIRERFKLRGRIRAISAHGRMTGVALTCIPLGVAIIMFYVNPEYARFFLEDDTGRIMIGAAGTLQVIGYMVIRHIVNIEI